MGIGSIIHPFRPRSDAPHGQESSDGVAASDLSRDSPLHATETNDLSGVHPITLPSSGGTFTRYHPPHDAHSRPHAWMSPVHAPEVTLPIVPNPVHPILHSTSLVAAPKAPDMQRAPMTPCARTDRSLHWVNCPPPRSRAQYDRHFSWVLGRIACGVAPPACTQLERLRARPLCPPLRLIGLPVPSTGSVNPSWALLSSEACHASCRAPRRSLSTESP
jgi:hypothetical protein